MSEDARGEKAGASAAAGSGAPDFPSISVIIPARNAAAALPAALDSIVSQDYPGPVETIVADGSDTPATAAAARRQHPAVRVIANPERTTPHGLNRALRAASGRIVVRCDAHAALPPGYLRRVAATIARTGAANVGGRQQPVGVSFFERAAAAAMTTFLGAGNARYRLGGAEGPTDTVYLGAFRREALEAVGGFNTALARNQDYELNWRLRQRGETVWFDPELAVAYRPRGSFRALARQYFDYGRWKAAVLRSHPASLRAAQHLAAPLLVLSLTASAVSALLGRPQLAAAAPLVYLSALAAGSAAVGLRRREPAAVLMPLVLAAMHLSWGIGFFFPARPERRRRRAAEAGS